MATITFDATTVEPDFGMAPLPAGSYIAQAIESEIKTAQSGTGQYVQFTWKVLDGQYKGRLVFDRINVKNANQVAEQIGQKQLSALCHAAGVLRLQDTMQLHNKPVKLRLVIHEDDKYGDSNEVKGYEPAGMQGMQPAAAPAPFAQFQPSFAPPPQAAHAAPAAAPWMTQRA
ncbi:MAG: DUF669 domain-containing protein [Zoogloeaceae bacterium]|nr:DUF669 domain-containing protein [Zoogloeaceae bacterium]